MTGNIWYDDYDRLREQLRRSDVSRIVVFCDENTARYCLPRLSEKLEDIPFDKVVMLAGEEHKNLVTCEKAWHEWMMLGLDRHSVVINLGGGVVGDLGGFCAATYMRGIRFYQIPTTLLAQVDASVGGKTGVDFMDYKNMIGAFAQPTATLIDTAYLDTLPTREVRNGFVEMIKHAMIANAEQWKTFLTFDMPVQLEDIAPHIVDSIAIKQNIVTRDPLEKGERKVLNFGHTVGHALEHLQLSQSQDIRHGEAVAFGIMVALELSRRRGGLTDDQAYQAMNYVRNFMLLVPSTSEIDALIASLRHDKKNKDGVLQFSLLEKLGRANYNQRVEEPELRDVLKTCISFAEAR